LINEDYYARVEQNIVG